MVGNRTHGEHRFLRVFLLCSLFPVAGCLIFSGCGSGGGGTTFTQPQVTLKKVVQVAAGYSHTCAVLSDSTIKCWGRNNYGQLGNSSKTDSYVPVGVSGISSAISVAVGSEHSCALLSNGTVMCWGRAQFGELGNGTTGAENCYVDKYGNQYGCSTTPVPVSGISNATLISSGLAHTCAVISDGSIQCWGVGIYGQLGDGAATNSSSPVLVANISNAKNIAAGDMHTCVVLSDMTVKCWGANFIGQLGNKPLANPEECNGNPCSTTPIAVSEIINVKKLSGGTTSTCALLSDQTLKCWKVSYSSLSELSNVQDFSIKGTHLCAVLSNGSVKCIGSNNFGELGNGTSSDSGNISIAEVVQINNAVNISAGTLYSCSVLNDGSVKCWGDNQYGQLGVGTKSGPEACIFSGGSTSPCSTVPVAVDASLYAAAPRMMKNFFFAFADLFLRLTPG